MVFLKCLSAVLQQEAAPLVKLKHLRQMVWWGCPNSPSSPPALTRLLLQAVDTGLGDSMSHQGQLTLLTHTVTGRSVAISNCLSPHLEQNGFFSNEKRPCAAKNSLFFVNLENGLQYRVGLLEILVCCGWRRT